VGHVNTQRGFTLIEILVVIVVIGIAMAMVSINGLPGGRQGLRFEAERLAQLLVLAREESDVRGTPIRLDADDSRFRFLILRNRQWEPLLDDRDLRERAWDAPTRVTVRRPDGRPVVEFGRQWIDVPFSIGLTRDGASVAILANGLGTFEVQ
jgi:general secretion pathway protein H